MRMRVRGLSEKWYVISGLGSRRLQLNWTESGPSLYTHNNDNLRSVHPDGDIRFRLQLSIKGRHILDLHCVASIWTCASTADWLLVTAYCIPRLSTCHTESHPYPDSNLIWHLSVSACRILWQAGRVLSLTMRMLRILKLNFKPHQSIDCPLHATSS